MSGVSDAHVIGILVFLVLGAVSYYFYSRMNNLERKVGLMENILFDLKVTTEQALQIMTDPAEDVAKPLPLPKKVVHDDDDQSEFFSRSDEGETREVIVESTPRSRQSPSQVQVERKDESSAASAASTTPNYESMTYKELVSIARQKSISGLRNMSKAQVIEALRGRESGAKKSLDISSWMQDTTPLQEQDDHDAIDSQELGPTDMNGTVLTPEESDDVEASLVSS